MKSVSWLIEYVKAQKGKPYWFGTFGQTGSAVLNKSKKKLWQEGP